MSSFLEQEQATITGGSITVDQGTPGATPWPVKIDQTGTNNDVDVVSSVLPTGASTSANQLTEIASLASIDSKLTNPLPVSGPLTDAQLRATPVPVSGAVTVSGTVTANLGTIDGASTSALQTAGNISLASIDSKLTNPLPVSGTVTANAGTGNFTVVQPTGTNLHTVVDNFPATQPVSGTVTVTQATGTNLHAVIDSGTVTVSGTVTANLGTIDGAATAANQTAANTSLASIDSKTPALGQATMAASSPVVIASNQSAIPVSGSVTVTQATGTNLHTVVDSGTITANIGSSGSLALDATVSALEVSQASTTSGQKGILSLSASVASSPTYVDGQTNPLTTTLTGRLRTDVGSIGGTNLTVGQKTMANSIPIVIASDQSSFSVNALPQDGSKATYSASATAITPALLATDVFTITGSATKLVRITKAYLDGTSTGGVNVRVLAIKRSTADTAGTSTTLTNVPHDSTQAAATVTVLAYTANPTLGTAVGTLRTRELAFPTAGTQLSTDGDMLNAVRPAKAIVLRGVAEQVCFNLNGVTVAGGSLNFNIEWTEE